jgi:hypothetical protein
MPALVNIPKNGLPKEVIVIDDSPPTLSHTGVRVAGSVRHAAKKRKRGDDSQETPANGRTNVQLGQKRKGVGSQAKRKATEDICSSEDDDFSDACSNPQSRSYLRRSPTSGLTSQRRRLITYSRKKQRRIFKKTPKGMLSVTFSMEICSPA